MAIQNLKENPFLHTWTSNLNNLRDFATENLEEFDFLRNVSRISLCIAG